MTPFQAIIETDRIIILRGRIQYDIRVKQVVIHGDLSSILSLLNQHVRLNRTCADSDSVPCP